MAWTPPEKDKPVPQGEAWTPPTTDSIVGDVKKKEVTPSQKSAISAIESSVAALTGSEESTTPSAFEAPSISQAKKKTDLAKEAVKNTAKIVPVAVALNPRSPTNMASRSGFKSGIATVNMKLADNVLSTETTPEERNSYTGFNPLYRTGSDEGRFKFASTPLNGIDFWTERAIRAEQDGGYDVQSYVLFGQQSQRGKKFNLPVETHKVLDDYMKWAAVSDPQTLNRWTLINQIVDQPDSRWVKRSDVFVKGDEKYGGSPKLDTQKYGKKAEALFEKNVAGDYVTKRENGEIYVKVNPDAIYKTGEEQLRTINNAFINQYNILKADYYKKSNGFTQNPIQENGLTLSENFERAWNAIAKVQEQIIDSDPEYAKIIEKQRLQEEELRVNQIIADAEYKRRHDGTLLGELDAYLYYSVAKPVTEGVMTNIRSLAAIPNTIAQTVGGVDAVPMFKDFSKFVNSYLTPDVTTPTQIQNNPYGFESLVGQTTNTVTRMAGFIYGAKGLHAIGMGKRSASFMSSYLNTYNDYYEEGLRSFGGDEEKANDYAIRSATTTSLIEFAVPSSGLIWGVRNDLSKYAVSRIANGANVKSVITDYMQSLAKTLPREEVQEFLQLVGDKANNYYTNLLTGTEDLNDKLTYDEIIQTGIITLTSTGAINLRNIKRPNTLQKSALYAAANDLETFTELVNQQVSAGKLDKNDAEVMLNAVGEVTSILSGLPSTFQAGDVSRKNYELSGKDKMDVATIIYEKKKLEEQAKNQYIDPEFKKQKDQEIKEKVDGLNKEIQDIVNKYDADKLRTDVATEAQTAYDQEVRDMANNLSQAEFVDEMMDMDFVEGSMTEEQAREQYSQQYEQLKQEEDDRTKGQPEISGEEQVGEELVETELDEGTGEQEIAPSGILQTQEEIDIQNRLQELQDQRIQDNQRLNELGNQIEEARQAGDMDTFNNLVSDRNDLIDQMQRNRQERFQLEDQFEQMQEQRAVEPAVEEAVEPEFELTEEIPETPEERKKWSDSMMNRLNNWDERLRTQGRETLGAGIIPHITVARGAVKAMKAALATAQTMTDVIQAGIDHIKKSKWYQNLTDEQRAEVDAGFEYDAYSMITRQAEPTDRKKEKAYRDKFKEATIKAGEFIRGTISGVRQGLKEGRISQKEVTKAISDLLKHRKIDSVISVKDATDLINSARRVSTLKDLDNFEDKLIDIIEKSRNKAYEERVREAEEKAGEFIRGTISGVRQGLKEGKIKAQEVSNAIRDLMKARPLFPNISRRDFVNLVNAARNVNTVEDLDAFEDKLIEAATKQKEKAAVNKGISTKKKIKRASKNAFANEQEIVRDFLAIDPRLVSDINEYNDISDAILNTLRGTSVAGRKVSRTEALPLQEIADYVKANQNAIPVKPITDTYAKLVNIAERLGLNVTPTMTEDALIDMIQAEQELQIEEANDELAREINDKKKEVEQVFNDDAGGLSSFYDGLTRRQRDDVDTLLRINPDDLSLKQKAEYNDVLNNMANNLSWDGSGKLIIDQLKKEGHKKMKEAADKYIKDGKIRKFYDDFDGVFENMIKRGIEYGATLPQMIKLMTLHNKIASTMREGTGLNQLYSGAADVTVAIDNLITRLADISKKHKGTTTPESLLRQGMASVAIQNLGGLQADIDADFQMYKNLILQSIEVRLQSASPITVHRGKVEQEIYDEIIRDANNAQEVLDKLTEGERKMVEAGQEWFKEQKDELDYTSRVYLNSAIPMVEGYLPISYENNPEFTGEEADRDVVEEAMANAFISNIANTRPSGTTIARQRVKSLYNKDGEAKRILSFDFQHNLVNKARQALMQNKTIQHRMLADKSINSKFMNDFIGVKNKKSLHNAFISSINYQFGVSQYNNEFERSLVELSNSLTQAGASYALASPTQLVKQVVPVLLGGMVNLRGNIGLALTAPAVDFSSTLFSYSNLPERIKMKAGTQIESYVTGAKRSAIEAQQRNAAMQIAMDAGMSAVDAAKWVSDNSKKISDFFMSPLVRGDAWSAKKLWQGFYAQYLMDEKKVGRIDWNAQIENPDKDASAYADQMVEQTLNVNQQSLLSSLYKRDKNVRDIVRNMLFSFSSFATNQKLRTVISARQTRKGRFGIKGGAGTDITLQGIRDFSAVTAENALYGSILVGIGTLVTYGARELLQSLGIDDDEAEKMIPYDLTEQWKRAGAKFSKDILFGGMGAPVEDYGSKVVNYIYKESTGSDRDLIYVPEDQKPWGGMGVYTVVLDKWYDLYNNTRNWYVGKMPKVTKGGLKDIQWGEYSLTDNERDAFGIFALNDLLNILGVNIQEVNGVVRKSKNALQRSVESEKTGGVKLIPIGVKGKQDKGSSGNRKYRSTTRKSSR